MKTPTEAKDWALRYAEGQTPWDLGDAHPELLKRLASGALGEPARALVPGCGRGHDALALARGGWHVTALDFVNELEPDLETALEPLGGRFACSDFLHFDAEPFDLLFDHTFFCALPLQCRAAWGVASARLLRPGGRLAALVFPVGRPAEEAGPPFAMTTNDLAEALGNSFLPICDEPAEKGPGRRWSSRWAVFERVQR